MKKRLGLLFVVLLVLGMSLPVEAAGLADKMNDLGLDAEKLLHQANGLCEQWGKGILNTVQETIQKTFVDSVKDFFSDMTSTVVDFFKGLF
ncbi:MAG: hypothetical protein PUI41_00695 [Lachnospiraceae bacterium]|nr:hypothetical protein [Lachnospiraceae bacterium]MCI7595088.1 hypothetical protein [Lachnospiraceae bacterium]MDD7049430.1 hypothetical protein [Lachnospiraceae bacterium]MDY3222831.1 hypothetical protein [Lachnospiraceae bacterium]MDY4095267.1 hypothetical protein [Lachnospiraceae bacterium]